MNKNALYYISVYLSGQPHLKSWKHTEFSTYETCALGYFFFFVNCQECGKLTNETLQFTSTNKKVHIS